MLFKNTALILFGVFIGALLVFLLYQNVNSNKYTTSPIKIIQRPLDKYTIENLASREIKPVNINVHEPLGEMPKNEKFIPRLFSFSFDPTGENGSQTKKVTGQINLPLDNNKHPLVLMIRGYVDQSIYQTGIGTKRAAEVFASNGYITLAPDFLGYGGSDPQSPDIFEARFQTYTTVLVLLNSIGTIDQWDGKNIFIWAHSNGGQIAITALEITERPIPTTLWAPVSKPFPYSVLYYTDESDDRGKKIRSELARFEQLYDVEKYSLDNYLNRVTAPIQIHQGTADDAIPKSWSDSLIKSLKNLNLDPNYYVYPGADHNLQPAWNIVVARDLDFFKKHIID